MSCQKPARKVFVPPPPGTTGSRDSCCSTLCSPSGQKLLLTNFFQSYSLGVYFHRAARYQFAVTILQVLRDFLNDLRFAGWGKLQSCETPGNFPFPITHFESPT